MEIVILTLQNSWTFRHYRNSTNISDLLPLTIQSKAHLSIESLTNFAIYQCIAETFILAWFREFFEILSVSKWKKSTKCVALSLCHKHIQEEVLRNP